jgi:HSP20 family protein
MSLVRWQNPIDLMPGFSNLADTFFGKDMDFFGDFKSTVPKVNIREDKKDFYLEVAAPGMSKEDFDVNLDNNVLTISGKKEHKKEEKDKYNRREFSYTSFERSFYLPEVIDSEHIEAHYQDGILMITVPKKEESKEKSVKRISIM